MRRVGSSGAFDQITDFGKSGWFLWPLGFLFLALAALAPIACRAWRNRCWRRSMVRVGFLFAAIAVPGLFVTVVKRLIGRARPLVSGHVDPFLFHPFIWRADYASLPSGHATTAFSVLVAFGSLLPRARTVLLALCAGDRDEPDYGDARTILSDVIAGAVVGDGRRAPGAPLVRVAPARLFDRTGRHTAPMPGPSLRADQNGCPRRCWPHKKRVDARRRDGT